MTTSEVSNFTEIPTVNEGIERFELHEYEPAARTNLNSVGEISTNVEQQDLFTLPSEAFLLFKGRLVKLADGTDYANAYAVTLTNIGIMHLLSQISYQLSNQEVEAVYHPGQATTMLGMLKYPNDFPLAQGLDKLWYKDSATTAVLSDNSRFAVRQAYIIQKPTTKGTFSFCILLKHIFGFCDDYDKVIYGFKHTLTLVRKSDDDATFRLAAAAAGKFSRRQCDTISVPQSTTFSWRLNVKISPEKPRYIIVGFQTSKDGSQELDPSIFDHCDLKNMYIMLNQERYPAVDYNLSFPSHQFSRAHRDASVFSEKY
ncbi:uncharacterized protein LOC136081228 [Hydra vulgaris]|uniref:Uncharacterized protein LOC136081228 n=1 Tax=Hydra vulgaris TaxID=6087 RepID=A0ABM4BZB0_HYDVU